MHCPTCRHENPATTRFCRGCGAVLVESSPDGRRRRVLRPWGMRRSAPLTVSPDMPDLIDDPGELHGTRLDVTMRYDRWIVVGLVLAVIAGTWIGSRPKTGADADPVAVADAGAAAPTIVGRSSSPRVEEADLRSSPLLEISPKPAALPETSLWLLR